MSSLLHDVEPAEHDHGVGKHEDVAGREEADVDVEVGQGNIAEAKKLLLSELNLISPRLKINCVKGSGNALF